MLKMMAEVCHVRGIAVIGPHVDVVIPAATRAHLCNMQVVNPAQKS
jgi:hypothetical protein